MDEDKQGLRRRHSAELKQRVLTECGRPGASVAAVALANGLNANLVHKWRRVRGAPIAKVSGPTEFVALPPLQPASSAAAAAGEIRIELRRGPIAMDISWPTAAATQCAAWLSRVLA